MNDSKLMYKLMTPGPVPLSEDLLKELALPVLHHRTDEFESILAQILKRLKPVFMTQQPCFVLTATGTGGMEASLVNTLQRGDTVISIDSGKFGARWHEMAVALGYNSIHLQFPWGSPIDLQKVADTLKKHPEARAILCQACETSTGALLPVEQLAQLTKSSHCMLIVDAITGLGAFPLEMDKWGLDVVISGSQKALGLPTGLTVLSLSPRALAAAKKIAPTQTYYWNLIEELKANEKTQTRFSSAVSLLRTLNVALANIERVGVAQIFKNHAERAEFFRRHVLKNGVTLFPHFPSPSLTCVSVPVDSQKLQQHLQDKYKIVVMGGQDQLKGKVLRIGHMGAMSLQDLEETSDAIHKSLLELPRV
jgi:aspartate aminotransferase-like enzyme